MEAHPCLAPLEYNTELGKTGLHQGCQGPSLLCSSELCSLLLWFTALPHSCPGSGHWPLGSRRFQKEVLSLPSALMSSSQVSQQLHMTQPPLLVATTDHPICLTKLRTSLGQGEKQDSVGVVGPRPITSPCLITKWVQDPDLDLWSPNEPVGRHVDPLKGHHCI